ncbi:MAG TPA: GntR family transcriptional regulator [Pseudonocardiaceae bacterium]|nr:GntR family transcriptional regulator [Pseudonocardiaceae bacterium]
MAARTSMLMTTESRPDGLQDFVARNLVRAIASGELPPGARLSPARLASDLGVSHIPVREALAALEAVGQVKRIPRVGFFVAEMSTEDIEDIYHWRQVLEDEAHRISLSRLSGEDLDHMRELNTAMAAAVDHGDTYAELDRAFHFVPFQRAGSDHLLRFITHLWDAAGRYHGAVLARVDRSVLQQHHDALLLAFDARDVNSVNALFAAHRDHTLAAIRQVS